MVPSNFTCPGSIGLVEPTPTMPTAPSSTTTIMRSSAGTNASSSQRIHAMDYKELLERRRRGTCPALFLAPMEGLGDRRFRRAFERSIGGFDEACTEFIRVPGKVENPEKMAMGLAKAYDRNELVQGTPIAAQLMGSNPEFLALVATLLCERGAPRIDLNCGCPANKVTGNGAGSTLLKAPEHLNRCANAIAAAIRDAGTGTIMTVKMRSGFDDASLLVDNLLAAQEAGAEFLTLHPRTKADGYRVRAKWEHIGVAKDVLRIPVVGNGDVISVAAAQSILAETGCDGIMIGRGAVQDPFLFHRCRCALGDGNPAVFAREAEDICRFVQCFAEEIQGMAQEHRGRRRSCSTSARLNQGKMNSLKQVCKYLFTQNPAMQAGLSPLLRTCPHSCTFEVFLERVLEEIHSRWTPGGLQTDVQVDHFSYKH